MYSAETWCITKAQEWKLEEMKMLDGWVVLQREIKWEIIVNVEVWNVKVDNEIGFGKKNPRK